MFNGSIPIVLDSLKQHYFIDRDGKMFRHILNFLRTNTLAIPDNFPEMELLYEEAKYYDIQGLIRFAVAFSKLSAFLSNQVDVSFCCPPYRLLEQVRQDRGLNGSSRSDSPTENGTRNCAQNLSTKRIRLDEYSVSGDESKASLAGKLSYGVKARQLNSRLMELPKDDSNEPDNYTFHCLAVNISPELGERVCISGERALIEEIFPEISQTIMDSSKAAAWNQDAKHVIRFPLNGFCKFNALQTIARLLNNGFRVMASNGGGVEGQQFSEYLMVRKSAR